MARSVDRPRSYPAACGDAPDANQVANHGQPDHVDCVDPNYVGGDPVVPEVNRKEYPITTGVLSYFPDALLEVAHVSWVGNEQHNPGTPLHWDRSKSADEADALGRHLLQRGTLDTDGLRHSAKVAWRALALLQKELEAEREGNGSADVEWEG